MKEDDPSLGYVNYIDHDSAVEKGLFNTDNGVVTFGADHNSIATGRGRSGLRLVTNKSYNHALVVADILHAPGSVCGSWNAFRLIGPNWPMDGEIDIIEGINSNTKNMVTLHTNQGCTLSGADCSTTIGCTQTMEEVTSYGDGFNANGGGVYAMEWTSDHINVWFWPRGSEPSDLSDFADPVGWGTPAASFIGGEKAATCEIDSHFRDQKIIFDSTFCGAWAGPQFLVDPACSAFSSSCVDFVQNNPSAFGETYWAVNSVKVYKAVTNTHTTGVSHDVDTDSEDSDDDEDHDKEHHHHHHHNHRPHRHHGHERGGEAT